MIGLRPSIIRWEQKRRMCIRQPSGQYMAIVSFIDAILVYYCTNNVTSWFFTSYFLTKYISGSFFSKHFKNITNVTLLSKTISIKIKVHKTNTKIKGYKTSGKWKTQRHIQNGIVIKVSNQNIITQSPQSSPSHQLCYMYQSKVKATSKEKSVNKC